MQIVNIQAVAGRNTELPCSLYSLDIFQTKDDKTTGRVSMPNNGTRLTVVPAPQGASQSSCGAAVRLHSILTTQPLHPPHSATRCAAAPRRATLTPRLLEHDSLKFNASHLAHVPCDRMPRQLQQLCMTLQQRPAPKFLWTTLVHQARIQL